MSTRWWGPGHRYGEGKDRRYWDGTQWAQSRASGGDGLVTAAWVCAFLIPILGIIALAQGKTAGPFVVSIVVAIAYYGIVMA